MAKSSFLKGLGKPFGILAILFILSIVLYYLYNNNTLEGYKEAEKKATVEEGKKKAIVEGLSMGRRRQ